MGEVTSIIVLERERTLLTRISWVKVTHAEML